MDRGEYAPGCNIVGDEMRKMAKKLLTKEDVQKAIKELRKHNIGKEYKYVVVLRGKVYLSKTKDLKKTNLKLLK